MIFFTKVLTQKWCTIPNKPTNISFHTAAIYIVLSTSRNHCIFAFEICFVIYCKHLKKVPEMRLKRSSFLKCAFWSNFRWIIFVSSKKFGKNQDEEKKLPNTNTVLQYFLGGGRRIFLFKRRRVSYHGMQSEAKE